MDCQSAEGMINQYMNHELSIRELEGFIRHMEECPECYEELESRFIVHKAVEQLSEEAETELDFRKLLEEDLKNAKHHIFAAKVRKIIAAAGSALVILGALAMILWFR